MSGCHRGTLLWGPLIPGVLSSLQRNRGSGETSSCAAVLARGRGGVVAGSLSLPLPIQPGGLCAGGGSIRTLVLGFSQGA